MGGAHEPGHVRIPSTYLDWFVERETVAQESEQVGLAWLAGFNHPLAEQLDQSVLQVKLRPPTLSFFVHVFHATLAMALCSHPAHR